MQLRICLAIDRLDLQEALKAESTMFLHDQLNLSYHPCRDSDPSLREHVARILQ